MAFRRKAGFILVHQPDILIVPECEHPDKLVFDNNTPKPSSMLWFGSNPHKGLGIFAYNDFTLKLRRMYNPELKLIVPIAAGNGKETFTLYAIWANNPADPDGQYVEQVWKAIHYYRKHLKNKQTILAGDFNSNTIWDRPHRAGNHSSVVKFLEKKKIYSAYHVHHQQEQGKEAHPTLYMYRHKDKPYHIDYCFVSEDLAARLLAVEIGEHGYWSKYSDHVPVMVTVNEI